MRIHIVILFFVMIGIAKTEDYILEFQAKVKNVQKKVAKVVKSQHRRS